MKKLYFLFLLLIAGAVSYGQISITTNTYSQDFDVMGTNGTTYPTGWSGLRFAGSGSVGAALDLVVNNGSGTSGAVYNVGTASASDRALGTLGSASTIPAFGASFVNNTGLTITDINFSGVMEQWKSGQDLTVENVLFSYSLDQAVTTLNNGNWTVFPSMDLVEKLTATTTATAVDGNNTANKTAISGNLTGLSWLNGEKLWIRWVDANDAQSDGMYAIDDLVMNFTTATAGIGKDDITGFSLYPNPVKGSKVFISSANNYAERSVAIFDVLGKQVVSQKGTQNSIDVSHLNKGVYIIKVAEEGKVATRKLVIE